MKVINTVKDWKIIGKKLTNTVGFVPTMGALHSGHAALIRQSKQQNDFTIVSIFVNPLQFNDINDYKHYPDTLNADKKLLSDLNIDYLFFPGEQEMYPQENKFMVDTDHPYMNILEGAHRPGHFNGVLTIVLKLLNCIHPTRIYFGEKDFQQYSLIKSMVADLLMDTEVIACPTVREADGIPYSSRNINLTAAEKKLAACAFKIIHQTNHKNIVNITDELAAIAIDFEYLEIKNGRVYTAIKVNNTRLIDNFAIKKERVC